MRASIVIGANYGDEGKGLVTDWLASSSKSEGAVVVRYSGGAQAGHTVVTPDGRRHVFHHFGSGSFAGAQTFLSRHFICNAISFAEELEELHKHGVHPLVCIDPRARLSTPWDLMINQALEQKRGHARHGSCGMGIFETLRRCAQPSMRTDLAMAANGKRFRDRLWDIWGSWVPARCEALGLTKEDLPEHEPAALLERYLCDVAVMLENSGDYSWEELDFTEGHLIFEGSQGLGLDIAAPDFPNVTPARVGLQVPLDMLDALSEPLARIDAYYVSRIYATRHGAGWLPLSEQYPAFAEHIDPQDETNIENPHQGKLRLAALDFDELFDRIASDLRCAVGHAVRPHAFITCMDQLKGEIIPARLGEFRLLQKRDLWTFPDGWNDLGIERRICCYGPTREDVEMDIADIIKDEEKQNATL